MSEDRPSLLGQAWRAALLVLATVAALWLAVQLLAQVWGWLLLGALASAAVAGLVAWLRARSRRW